MSVSNFLPIPLFPLIETDSGDTPTMGPPLNLLEEGLVPYGESPEMVPLIRDSGEIDVGAARELTDRYQQDWLLWVEEWLGISSKSWPDDCPPVDWDGKTYPLWSKQVEILKALQTHRKVAVRSGNGVGKTYIAAIAAMTMLYVLKALGLTTAPTFRQVKRLLWGEVHKLYNRANAILLEDGLSLGGQLNKTSLELDGKWFMEGFSTGDKLNMMGFHEEKLFLIVDEAGLASRELYDSIEAILTSEETYVLLIGNPLKIDTPFKDAFLPDSPYYQVQISVLDSPNLKHGRVVYPALTAPGWPEEQLRKYKTIDHPLYRARVLGEFPLDSEDQLIPWDAVQAALERDLPKGVPVSYGLDVARQGDDRSVWGLRHSTGKFEIVRCTEKERDTSIAGKTKLDVDSWGDGVRPCVNVDDIGVGGGVVDILEEDDYPVNGINVAEAPAKWEDPDGLFLNKRAAYYWNLRTLFIDGHVSIDDEELATELYTIKTEITMRGKIKIVEKEKIKRLIGKSPDKADCMMLAFAMGEPEGGRDLVRFL